ncbi:uncharacterized protein [Branchiostoma lanceolatum]|uniref:uncharacterized protein n=1 Tax=Branchiostoma lanceolatum TaxID=7740 RepID=UPI003451D64A
MILVIVLVAALVFVFVIRKKLAGARSPANRQYDVMPTHPDERVTSQRPRSGNAEYDEVPMETVYSPSPTPRPSGEYQNVPHPDQRVASQRPGSGSDEYEVPMETVYSPSQPPQSSGDYQELRPAIYQSLQKH